MRPLLQPEAGCFPGMRHRWYVSLPGLSLHDLQILVANGRLICQDSGFGTSFLCGLVFLWWIKSFRCEERINSLVGNSNVFNLIQLFCEVLEVKALIIIPIQSYNLLG